MMTTAQILKLTEPANQNLPKVVADFTVGKCEVVIIPVFEETAKARMKECSSLAKLKLTGKKKELHHIAYEGQICKVVGMGKKADMTVRKLRRFYGAAYLSVEKMKVKSVAIMVEDMEWMKFATLAIHTAALNPNLLKNETKKADRPKIVLVHNDVKTKATAAKKALKEGEIQAEGMNLMRVLGAMPPNSLNTDAYSEVIVTLCKKWGVKCKNVAAKDLKKYELLNSVSLGSARDSKLMWITVSVAGSKKAAVVVGKGLCYDSGGIQGKGSHMKTMKEDMAGSASVLGTILNITKNKLKLKQTTHFLLPLAENMMGAAANRADDVWTAGDGQTVEIHHTDAEGRLVMGDAICYAKNNVKEVIEKVYTIATLTGSCVSALGEVYTGALCNDETLRDEAVQAGKDSGDLIFPGPWDLEYDDNHSPIADVANLGEKQRDAGWIKAGFYLARFVPKDKKTGELTAKFCHFDIAGTIDMDASGAGDRQKGYSSGVGVGYLSLLLTK